MHRGRGVKWSDYTSDGKGGGIHIVVVVSWVLGMRSDSKDSDNYLVEVVGDLNELHVLACAETRRVS